MAGDRNFPGGSSPGVATSFTDRDPQSSGFSVPDGRVCANGKKPVRFTSLYAYCRGNGGTRTINLQLGSATTANFNVTAASSATSTGSRAITADYDGAASAIVKINGTGSIYFGRSSSSGSTTDGVTTWGGALSGQAHYVEAPTAPGKPTLTPASGQIACNWSAPSDDGGSAITGYLVEWADNDAFTDSSTHETEDDGTSYIITDLTPGQWYVRVFAINAVTDHWDTTSVASESANVRTGIGGKRWDGSAEVPFTQAFRWDGTQEVALTVAKRWTGTEEVDVV